MTSAGRVLHLSWIPDPGRWPGVVAKLGQMAEAARATGLPLDVAVVSRDGADGTRAVHYLPGTPPRRLQERLLRFLLLGRTCRLSAYRAVILRYSAGPDPSLWHLLAGHGRRLVSEHHSDEPLELRSLHPGPEGLLRATLERLRQQRLLAGIAGAIGVTGEIAGRLRSIAPGGTPVAVIPNGIDVGSIAATGFSPWRGGPLELGMLCGDMGPWFGIDRLLAGIEAEPEAGVRLHLVGPLPTGGLLARCRALGPRVRLHGLLRGAELDRVCAGWHLGSAALGMHRKGLAEACTLKVREYLARGLPFLVSHRDPDLPEGLPGCFRLPADDGTVSAAAITAAAATAGRAGPSLGDELRSWAARRCDWRPLVARMHAFALAATGA
ncbi:MAG: glycosyltransferase [Planctomycetes bacterium]|nr:glycosyltransferase [Planctomycetota bacterium]